MPSASGLCSFAEQIFTNLSRCKSRQVSYFSAIPQHDALVNRDRKIWLDTLMKSWSYPRFTPPKLESNGYYYFEYNDGIKPQAPVYRVNIDSILTDSGPRGELFFDPNLLSEDGVTALTGQAMSPCGKYWAYGISEHVRFFVLFTSSSR